MKKKYLSAVVLGMMVMTTACSNDDVPALNGEGGTGVSAGAKTVLIYMAGRNDLSEELGDDLREMKINSKFLRPNDNLVVFVRNKQSTMPWVACIRNGELTDSVSVSDIGIRSSDGENRASDPAVMEGVLHYAFSHYPAASGNYGLVIEGHGSGWLMKKDVKRNLSRAAAVDWGNSNDDSDDRWINIPDLAAILKGVPHMKFIMTDCCNMMCLENLYELRSVCDYMIGSPAEIPVHGAPYNRIVTDMFADGKFYTNIVDKYFSSVKGKLPLVAVKTSKMENVAQATRTALKAVNDEIGDGYPDMKGIIHYYHTDNDREFHPEFNIFYDAGDFIRTYAPADIYQQWRQVLDQAVVERRMAPSWATNKGWQKYSDFTVTEEKFHGVSMFVAQDPSRGDYAKYNEDIKKMEWYAATR